MYYARPILQFGNRSITKYRNIQQLKYFCHFSCFNFYVASEGCLIFIGACAAHNSDYALQLHISNTVNLYYQHSDSV